MRGYLSALAILPLRFASPPRSQCFPSPTPRASRHTTSLSGLHTAAARAARASPGRGWRAAGLLPLLTRSSAAQQTLLWGSCQRHNERKGSCPKLGCFFSLAPARSRQGAPSLGIRWPLLHADDEKRTWHRAASGKTCSLR